MLNGELYTCKLYKLINLCWSTGCFVKLHFINFTKQPVDQHRLINLYNLHIYTCQSNGLDVRQCLHFIYFLQCLILQYANFTAARSDVLVQDCYNATTNIHNKQESSRLIPSEIFCVMYVYVCLELIIKYLWHFLSRWVKYAAYLSSLHHFNSRSGYSSINGDHVFYDPSDGYGVFYVYGRAEKRISAGLSIDIRDEDKVAVGCVESNVV